MPLVTLLDSPASWRAVVPGESQIYDDHLNVLLKQKLNKQKKEKDTKWETDIAVFRVDAGSRTGESVRSGSSSGLVYISHGLMSHIRSVFVRASYLCPRIKEDGSPRHVEHGSSSYDCDIVLPYKVAVAGLRAAVSHNIELDPFTRAINFKFLLRPHQKYYITQYEELDLSWLTQMKNDCTTNSHYFSYRILFKGLGEFTFLNLG